MRAPADVPALARWRADTPGCARRAHLNNAGAALVPRPVRQAVDAYLDLEDELGGYEATDARAEAIQQAGDAVARLLGAHRRNLALGQNPTTAFAQGLGAGVYPLLVDMHGATWTDPDRFELTPDARRFESWEIAPRWCSAWARPPVRPGRRPRDRPGPDASPGRVRPHPARGGAGGAGARSGAGALRHRHRGARRPLRHRDQAGAPGARDQHQRTGPRGCGDRHGREGRRLGDPDLAALLHTAAEIDAAVDALEELPRESS